MIFRRLAWLPLVLTLAICGCKDEQVIGGKAAEKSYLRIASLSPATTEILALHSDAQRLVGRTASCNFPPNVGPAPVVTKGVKPDYEALAKIQPDLILLDATLYSDDDIQKLKSTTGADLMVLFSNSEGKLAETNTIDSFLDWLYRFGATQTDPMRISKYADNIFQARESALAVPLEPKPKVIVLTGGEAGESYHVAGTKSFQADVVRGAGGEPVGPNSSKFEVANLESLVSLDPDVILTSGDPNSVAKDGRLAKTRAVRAGRIARIQPDVLLRSGARVDLLLQTMHRFFAGSQGGQN